MISVDRLVTDLLDLNSDLYATNVWVQVDVDGKPHRLPLGSMQLAGGLVLVGEPAPVPDPVIAPVSGVTPHEHLWSKNEARELWRCTACVSQVRFEQLIDFPIPEDLDEGIALLNRLADAPSRA